MMKFFRWVLLLFSLYVLIAVGKFYVVHPDKILELDRIGFLRLAGFCIVAIGCYMLGKAIVNDLWKTSSNASSTSRGVAIAADVNDGSRVGKEHPFKMAFRRHPAITTFFALFLLSLPLILELIVHGVPRRSDTSHWCRILVGELIAAAVFIVAWYKARQLTRNS